MSDDLLESFTLERFLKHTEPRGACLVWTGHCNGTQPQVRIGGKRGHAMGVRRVVYLLTRGPGSVPANYQIGLRRECRCELCVHPDHLVARSRSTAQRGQPAPLTRKVRIAATKRRASKLTHAIVCEIRASEEKCIDLDARYGLTKGYASRIKRGKAWPEYGSAIVQLGARG